MPVPGGEIHAGGGNFLVEAYWKCDGIENACEIKGKEKYTRILGFEFGLTSPVDTQSGQSAGRRQEHPLVIRKLLDQSTPMIIDAIATNKQLEKSELIICAVFGKEQKKGDKFKVTLEKVRFVDIHTVGGQDGASIVDTVKMVFDKITYEDVPSKKIATDDWKDVS